MENSKKTIIIFILCLFFVFGLSILLERNFALACDDCQGNNPGDVWDCPTGEDLDQRCECFSCNPELCIFYNKETGVGGQDVRCVQEGTEGVCDMTCPNEDGRNIYTRKYAGASCHTCGCCIPLGCPGGIVLGEDRASFAFGQKGNYLTENVLARENNDFVSEEPLETKTEIRAEIFLASFSELGFAKIEAFSKIIFNFLSSLFRV